MLSKPSLSLLSLLIQATSVFCKLPSYLTTQMEANQGSVELQVSYGSLQIRNAEKYSVSEVQSLPQLAMCDSCGISTSSRYLIAMVDLDAFNPDSASPQFLHYMRADFAISDATELNSTSAPAVPYLPPAPPRGSGPHRYVWVLYNQPRTGTDDGPFKIKGIPGNTGERKAFDIESWQKENGFKDGPEWAVYFVAEEGVEPPRTTTKTTTRVTLSTEPTGTVSSSVDSSSVDTTPTATPTGGSNDTSPDGVVSSPSNTPAAAGSLKAGVSSVVVAAAGAVLYAWL